MFAFYQRNTLRAGHDADDNDAASTAFLEFVDSCCRMQLPVKLLSELANFTVAQKRSGSSR